MRRLVATAMFLAVLGLASACAPAAPPPPDTAGMEAAAAALDQQFLAAFNAGDAAALTALYWNSPDAVNFPPDAMMFHGFEAISAGNAEAIPALMAMGAHLELTENHQMAVGEVVLGWGLFTMTMNGPDGAPMTMAGRYSDVKAERDGRWVYIMDHASVPLPPAPDGGGN